MKKETESYVVEYDDGPDVRKAVFDKVIAFFVEHESFSGESVCQCDAPQLDAPALLAELADDVIKFKAKVKCPKCNQPYNNDEDLECGCP